MTFDLHSRRFYGILDLGYVAPDETISVATQMLEGGVEILQLRAKKLAISEIIKIALPLVPLCRSFGVPFIINDHPEVVVESGADGLHIGQDDISIDKARDLIGAGKIVGLSTHSVQQAKSALAHKPDYIGFGPLFSTPTKPDYTSIGTANIREVHSIVDLPIYCIGGIKRDNLPEVLAAGAQRVVIVSGILQSGQIADYCRSCKAALQ
ncbi:MAG: thiamine phosphate synthase [Spartobacteria bacterium]